MFKIAGMRNEKFSITLTFNKYFIWEFFFLFILFSRKPEKATHYSEFTGAPMMMEKTSMYGPPYAPGPYDNFSMRSYSPSGTYRGVAIMPEVAYDNGGYQGQLNEKF